jgi:hypothetical protein
MKDKTSNTWIFVYIEVRRYKYINKNIYNISKEKQASSPRIHKYYA